MNYRRFRRCIKKLSPELYDMIGTTAFSDAVTPNWHTHNDTYYLGYDASPASNMVRIDILEFIRYNKELIVFRLL